MKGHQMVSLHFFVTGKNLHLPPWVMRPTSEARWELRHAAAGGRCRRDAITAAVEKIEEQRKPEDFFDRRKAARSEARLLRLMFFSKIPLDS